MGAYSRTSPSVSGTARTLFLNDRVCATTASVIFQMSSVFSAEASNDVFKIGGFVGAIQSLKIFGKGSGFLTTGKFNRYGIINTYVDTCASNCMMATGRKGGSCLIGKQLGYLIVILK